MRYEKILNQLVILKKKDYKIFLKIKEKLKK